MKVCDDRTRCILRYGVQDAEHLASGSVAAIETMRMNKSDSVVYTHKYILHKQLPVKPGAHKSR